jgi:chromosome segregation ATPase
VSARWQELEKRLGTVEGLFGEQSRRLEGIQEELGPAVEELKTKVSALESDFAQYKVKITEVEGKLGESTGVVENLYQSIEEAAKSIASWEGKLQELQTWKQGLEKEIGEKISKTLETLPDKGKLEELEKAIAGILTEKEGILAELRSWYAEREKLQQELEGRKKDIEDLAKRITGDEAANRATQDNLQKMKEELERLSALRKDLEERLGQLNVQIATLETGLKSYEQKMDDLVGAVKVEVQELAKTVAAIQENLAAIKAQDLTLPQDAKDALEKMQETFDEVLQRLGKVEDFVQNFFRMGIETKIATMGEEIQAVEQKLQSITERYPAASLEIESLRQMVEELQKGKLDIEKRFESLTQEIEGLKKEKEITGDLESLTQEKEQLRQEIESLAQERITLDGELQKKQDEVERIKEELQKLETAKGSAEEIKRLQETLKQAEDGVRVLRERLQEKEAQIEALQKKNEELTFRLEEAEKYTSYVILPWDNLWTIARRYYRDGRKWKAILEANKDIITDPHKLQPYVEIRVPRQVEAAPNDDCSAK